MKRKLALLLSAVMASLPWTAYAANFKDMNNVPWAGAETVINSVADKGLLSGYEDGTFRAKNNVTYCEAMQMVYNVLVKTGTAKPIEAVDAYAYMAVLDTYHVPKWAQYAIAYGLQNNICDLSMVATKFAGGNQAASREDVALLFGNALGMYYDREKEATEAKKFVDYWNISADALEQIDLLKRLGIISGDNYNNFNPKKNINRAEMAVMLNKTNDTLTQGAEESGTISKILVNEKKYYNFTVKMDKGGTEYVQATLGELPIYSGNTTIALDQLHEGDQVTLMRSGSGVIAMRLKKGSTVQSQYDMTGYVSEYKNDVLTFENENTGESVSYTVKPGAKITVDGASVSRAQLKNSLDEQYNKHAYAGMKTVVEREKNGGIYEDVTYVQELDITFTDTYSRAGEVKSFTASNVKMKLIGNSSEVTYSFAKDCVFYIGDTKSTAAELVKLADSGTFYVKITINAEDKVSKVIMSENTFAEVVKDTSKIYTLKNLNDKKLVVEEKGESLTFAFGSTNPLENITFYGYNVKDKKWDKLSNVAAAQNFADDPAAYNGLKTTKEEDRYRYTMYCKVVANQSKKLTEVYLSTNKQAWSNTSEEQIERKGTVASLQEDVLKFKTSSGSYTMLGQYNKKDSSGDIANPLKIFSVKTESKKVLTKLANDPAMVLYAEIVADGNNRVTKVEARLTEASGKLVEYNQEEKIIKIATAAGEYQLLTVTKPKLKDEDKDNKTFTLDDIATSKYVGEPIKLGFNSSGLVNQLELENGPNASNGLTRIKGVATAAKDGLQIEGSSKVYTWLSNSKTNLRVYGSSTKSLDTIKNMIEDGSVKVYVEALLDDKERVDTITVYVKSAEGELTSCDKDNVRIQTSSGNKYSFYLPSKLQSCDVKGLNQEKLEDGRADNKGYKVKLTFGEDGTVSGIASN